jgi:hydrogenase maturation protease
MIDADMDDKVLVAGIGNIFLSDDGFGPEAARQLATTALPSSVRVIDYGISGIHLVYDLLDGYTALIILDAVQRGGMPGDLAVIEVGQNDLGQGRFDAHGMEPTVVLASLGTLGGRLPRTFVIGCEPADLSGGMGLSPPVAAAAARTGVIVGRLLREELRIPFSDEQSIRTVSTALEGS